MRNYVAAFSLVTVFIGALGCQGARATEVVVYDRASHQELPLYRYHNRWYIAGEPGHEYEIRIHHNAVQRVLAVTTVDGVNVITGETGSFSQAGYVLDPYGSVQIAGWRKSLSHVADFYFTALADSYAAKTGRPDQVGVIGVALFRERVALQESRTDETKEEPSDSASRANRLQNAPTAAAPSSRRAEKTGASADAKLGTGHGQQEYSAVSYTNFEKAATVPDETIAIYYDSQRNLTAQGIVPRLHRYAERLPQPFPGQFTPDP